MTRDEIVAFFQRREDGMNRLDAAMVASLHTEDGVVESPFAGGIAEGRDAIERVYQAFFRSFSTAEFRQEQLIIDGDQVAVLAHIHGTNKGGVMGLPPTDRPFSISLVSLCDLRDGLIARERRIYDFTGLLLQVGAIKAKPA
ncbi:MAG TPA: ester cyclase [Vicinamibacterales bacterium]|nr:ester cyclase [Vicinamibacterales bacterium]